MVRVGPQSSCGGNAGAAGATEVANEDAGPGGCGIPWQRAVEAVEWAERSIATGLWQRSMTADQRIVEVPLLAAERGAPGEDLPSIVSALGDLLTFRESTGWGIVDHKAAANIAARWQALIEHYRPDVNLCVERWQQALGTSVAERWPLWVEDGIYTSW